jgi:septum site-determining protein MinD
MKPKILAVASGKGGVGKTFIAVNLGIALTQLNQESIVIDADLNAPKLAIQLGCIDFPVTLDMALRENINPLNLVYFHSSGLRYVPASISLNYIRTNPKKLSNILSQFKKLLILDCPPGFGKETRDIIKISTEVLVVTNPDLPSVTDAIKLVELSKRMKKDVIGIVLNRIGHSSKELSIDEVEKACGAKVIATVPEDKWVYRSILEKRPLLSLNPYSKAALEIKKLAAIITGVEFTPPKFLFVKRIIGRLI